MKLFLLLPEISEGSQDLRQVPRMSQKLVSTEMFCLFQCDLSCLVKRSDYLWVLLVQTVELGLSCVFHLPKGLIESAQVISEGDIIRGVVLWDWTNRAATTGWRP